MFSGDIYTQKSQSLGYGTGDWGQMGWSCKPRFSASVRVGNWYEENVPVPLVPAPEMISTARESFRSPVPAPEHRPDATVRMASLIQQTQGKGPAVLLGANSLPSLTSLYSSSFGSPGGQTERAYDRNSGKWLPEPIDVLASSSQQGYGSTSSVKWFRSEEPAKAMQSTMKSTYGAPAAGPLSPEDKRFARSYSFSRHLLTSRTISRS